MPMQSPCPVSSLLHDSQAAQEAQALALLQGIVAGTPDNIGSNTSPCLKRSLRMQHISDELLYALLDVMRNVVANVVRNLGSTPHIHR